MTIAITATKTKSNLCILAGIIGNTIEHYDTALYGFLAPFIAPLFFPNVDSLTATILAYAILPLDLIAKPLGSIIFGRIGDQIGRHRALSLSLIGTAACTGLLGFLPIHTQIGSLAPMALALTRFGQKVFSAGECVGGAIFILEHHSEERKGFLGSLYSCSTIIGILLASAFIGGFETFGIVQSHWRCLFWIGALTSLAGFYIRYRTFDSNEFTSIPKNTHSIPKMIRLCWKPFLAIVATAGFSYATYEVSFIFLNSFAPLVSKVTKVQMLTLNTLLLALDMATLPLFGLFADRISPKRQMQITSLIALTVSIPFMAICENSSFATIICIRTLWVLIGVAYCAPFHAWSQTLVPVQYRYTVISLGYTIGSQLIGAPFASIGLWIYQKTGLAYLPGVYLAGAALLSLACLQLVTHTNSATLLKQNN